MAKHTDTHVLNILREQITEENINSYGRLVVRTIRVSDIMLLMSLNQAKVLTTQ